MASNMSTDDNANSVTTKLCAYCKNHGEKIPLSGHKPCPNNNKEHFLICKPCKKNRNKTVNVIKWRKKKKKGEKGKKPKLNQNEIQGCEDSCLSQAQTTRSATDFTGCQVMPVDSQMTDYNPCENFNGTGSININNDTITFETFEVDKMLETFNDISADSLPITDTIQEESTDDYDRYDFKWGKVHFVQPTNYPDETLTHDEVEQFQLNLQNIIEKIPENNRQPKFLLNRYSLKRWELKFADEYTMNWFQEEFFNITYNNSLTKTLRLVLKSHLTNFLLKLTLNRSVFEKEFEIISTFHRQNRGLDTSRWEILNKKESQDEVELTFKVDPLSYKKLKENDFILYIGGNHVKLSLVKDWKGNSSSSIMSKKTHGKIDPP